MQRGPPPGRALRGSIPEQRLRGGCVRRSGSCSPSWTTSSSAPSTRRPLSAAPAAASPLPATAPPGGPPLPAAVQLSLAAAPPWMWARRQPPGAKQATAAAALAQHACTRPGLKKSEHARCRAGRDCGCAQVAHAAKQLAGGPARGGQHGQLLVAGGRRAHAGPARGARVRLSPAAVTRLWLALKGPRGHVSWSRCCRSALAGMHFWSTGS